jgi:enoyl-CoA hydratase/carnithine racemase
MEACSSYFLPRLVGVAKCNEWILRGHTFTARSEEKSGLFNYVLEDPKDVLPKAMQLAKVDNLFFSFLFPAAVGELLDPLHVHPAFVLPLSLTLTQMCMHRRSR